MRFVQIPKHRPGGFGSPCVWTAEEEAERALSQSVEIKPGMRAIRLPDGSVAIFRNSSKKPGAFGYDIWHGGWQANENEMEQVGDTTLPTYVAQASNGGSGNATND